MRTASPGASGTIRFTTPSCLTSIGTGKSLVRKLGSGIAVVENFPMRIPQIETKLRTELIPSACGYSGLR